MDPKSQCEWDPRVICLAIISCGWGNANNLISLASNGGKEAEVEPDVQELVDGLLHMDEVDAISHWKQ